MPDQGLSSIDWADGRGRRRDGTHFSAIKFQRRRGKIPKFKSQDPNKLKKENPNPSP
jgi:hypothetical protein